MLFHLLEQSTGMTSAVLAERQMTDAMVLNEKKHCFDPCTKAD